MPKWRRCCRMRSRMPILMGVDEQAMRRILAGMVDGLESPKRA